MRTLSIPEHLAMVLIQSSPVAGIAVWSGVVVYFDLEPTNVVSMEMAIVALLFVGIVSTAMVGISEAVFRINLDRSFIFDDLLEDVS